MEKLTKEVEAILLERFGKDSIVALATAIENIPYVRSVDAFYEDGAFYVLTYGLSSKMKQIEQVVDDDSVVKQFFYIDGILIVNIVSSYENDKLELEIRTIKLEQ